MSETAPAATKARSPVLTPARVLIALLGVEALLYLSQHFQWFAFNERKGWTVLIVAAAVVGTLALLLLWYAASLLFRWRFQFTIRTLLLLIVVVAGPNAWLVKEWKAAARQTEIVEQCRRAQCGILYEENLTAQGTRMFSGARPQPNWMEMRLGSEFFRDVVGASPRTDEHMFLLHDLNSMRQIFSNDSAVSDSGLKYAARWTRLERADFSDAPGITDAGMEYLRGLSQLKMLRLRRCKVGDAGMAHLENLTALQELDLGMTGVTDEGFKHFRNARGLRQVLFWGNKISDAGMAYFKEMPQLEMLQLGGAPGVTDAGLENLKGLTQLKSLWLRGTGVTDEGMEHLSGLVNLRELDLFNTKVGDKGLYRLRGLSKLETLYLGETKVTADGIKEIKAALPNCQIK